MSNPSPDQPSPALQISGYVVLLVILLLWCQAILSNQESSSLLWGIPMILTLVVHEAGHLFFYWFQNMFLYVLGGSLFQIIIPLGTTIYFWRKRQKVGRAVALFWLGESSVNLSRYIGDARTQALNLVSIGQGEPLHDWHWLLSQLNPLNYDHDIARVVYTAALLCFGLGVYFLVRKIISLYSTALPNQIAS